MKTVFVLTSIFFMFVLSPATEAQNITVSGFVTDLNNGDFLESVNVFESVSTIGTLSDKHGFYKLMLKKGEAKILATHNGYSDLSKEIMLKNDTTINLRMTPVIILKGKQKLEEQAQHINLQETVQHKKRR